MRYRSVMNLHIFDGEGEGSNTGGNGGTGNGSQSGNAGYTFEQAEEIANSRAEKASRAALADYFRKQGLSEEEITTAIADFKAKQKANQPNVSKIEKERDTYKQQVEQMNNEKVLTGKGVKAEDLDYVMFKVSKMVDDKTDFAKAAERFLKENPRFTGTGVYRVSTSTGTEGNGSGGSVNSSINNAIRSAARR